jgi:hypothetical protein
VAVNGRETSKFERGGARKPDLDQALDGGIEQRAPGLLRCRATVRGTGVGLLSISRLKERNPSLA